MNHDVTCYSLGDLPEDLIIRWNRLIADNPIHRRAFLSPRYCQAVLNAGADVRVILISSGASMGVIPIQMKPGSLGSLRVAERVGGEMSDYFGIIADNGLIIDIEDILSRTGFSAIEFSHLDETQRHFGLVGENPRKGLRTVLPDSGADFWRQLRLVDKRLVVDIERRERKLATEHGDIAFEFQSSRPDEDLDVLISLKHAQYLRTGQSSAPLLQSHNIRLVQDLLSSSDPACSGVLSVLRSNQRLISASFGLRCYDTLHGWFPVYDPDFGVYSPSRVLRKQIILATTTVGIRNIDMGEGENPAKKDFANEEHLYYRGVWSPPNLLGAAGKLAIAANWRLKGITFATFLNR